MPPKIGDKSGDIDADTYRLCEYDHGEIACGSHGSEVKWGTLGKNDRAGERFTESLQRRSATVRGNTVKTKIGHYLSGGLNDEQLQTMHEQALSLLGEVGMEVPHQQVLSMLTDHDGVSLSKNHRVCFEPDLVNKSVAGISYPKGEAFAVLSGAYSMNILDLDTGQIRQPTTADLVETTKLADSLGMSVIAPVTPCDVPVELQQIVMFKIVWENSSRGIGGGVVTTIPQAECIYEMARVVDRPFSLGLWV